MNTKAYIIIIKGLFLIVTSGQRQSLRLSLFRPLLLAHQDGLLEKVEVELRRLDSVVVARHRVRDDVGVAVRVDHADGGDGRLGGAADDLVVAVGRALLCVEDDHAVGEADFAAKHDLGLGENGGVEGAAVGVLSALQGRSFHHVDHLRLKTEFDVENT